MRTLYFLLLDYSLYQFRIDAEDSYQELTNILQLEDVVASDSTYYKINAKDYEHFLGTYKDSTSTAIISMESDKLFYQWKDFKRVRLFPISKNSFIQTMDASFNTIVVDSTGHTQSHNWHYKYEQGIMKKQIKTCPCLPKSRYVRYAHVH